METKDESGASSPPTSVATSIITEPSLLKLPDAPVEVPVGILTFPPVMEIKSTLTDFGSGCAKRLHCAIAGQLRLAKLPDGVLMAESLKS